MLRQRLCLKRTIRMALMGLLATGLAGCATTPTQPTTLTPLQQQNLQQIRAMQARWRNEDLLDYSRAPGGAEAWRQLRYH